MSKEKKIYVVGIGPGSYEGMTGAAATALEKSDVIVGYTVYIDLVKDHFPGKSFLTTPMRKEVDRCVMAFDGGYESKYNCAETKIYHSYYLNT